MSAYGNGNNGGYPLPETPWRHLLGTARRYWWLLTAGPVLTIGATILWIALSPAEYRATAVLRLADARRALTRGVEQTTVEPQRSTEQLLSQIQMLRSRWVASAVVDSVGLRLQPSYGGFAPRLLTDVKVVPDAPADTLHLEFAAASYTVRGRAPLTGGGPTEATAPYGSPVTVGGATFTVTAKPRTGTSRWAVLPREEAIDRLIEHIKTSRRPSTSIVDLSYTTLDPALAQRVANSLAGAYQTLEARSAQDQSKRRRVFLDEQLRRTDSLLTEAQGALSAFRSRQQVFSSRDKLAAQQVALLDLETRRIALDANRDSYRALLDQVEHGDSTARRSALRTLAANPEVVANPVIVQLYNRLLTQQQSLDSLRALAAPGNPDLQRLARLATATEDELRAAMRSHVEALDSRATALHSQESRTAAEVRELPTVEAQEVRLNQQVDAIRHLGDQLREERQRAAMAEAIEVGEVEIIDLATLPYKPVPAFGALKLLLALILGVSMGAGAALLVERVDPTIRRPDEIESTLQIQSLALIPKVQPGKIEGTEAYRVLRTKLLLAPDAARARTVVVTSSIAGEGKSTTAANLAASLAWEGRRVLLVDGDLWRGRLHRLFRVRSSPGLAECLLNDEPLPQAIRTTEIGTLSFMPSGRSEGPPSDLVTKARVPKLFARLRDQYDIVLIDSPPVLVTAETQILTTTADGVVLVVRAGHTDRDVVQQAVKQITSVGGKLVGAVLNDPAEIAQRYGSPYYYGKYYARQDSGAGVGG